MANLIICFSIIVTWLLNCSSLTLDRTEKGQPGQLRGRLTQDKRCWACDCIT